MASGMETLISTLLKVAGFDPAEFSKGISGFISMVTSKLDEFDKRMNALEKLTQENGDKLDLLIDTVKNWDIPHPPFDLDTRKTYGGLIISNDKLTPTLGDFSAAVGDSNPDTPATVRDGGSPETGSYDNRL